MKAEILEFLKDLESIVEVYHNREGSFNFHYDSFELHPWATHLPKEVYDKMDIDDWAVRIVWTDNSFSYDTYMVTLNEILDWYDSTKTNDA